MSELRYGDHLVLMNLAAVGQEKGVPEGRRKFCSVHRLLPEFAGDLPRVMVYTNSV